MSTTELALRIDGIQVKEYVLHPGVNRLGRSATNDVRVDDLSVSGLHCELWLLDDSLRVRDLGSTNGTFLDGRKVQEGEVAAGQMLRLGSVEFAVINPPARVAIPAEALPGAARVAAPEYLADGKTRCCGNHSDVVAVFHCTQCGGHWCPECVRQLSRVGGRRMVFCGVCGGVVENFDAGRKKGEMPKVLYWLDRLADGFRPRPKYPARRRHR